MFEKIQEVLAESLGIDKEKITLDSKIKEDLGADSLNVLELVMKMEEELNIHIPDDSLINFKTVKDVVEYLEKI